MSRLFTLIFISIFYATNFVYSQIPQPNAGRYSCLTTQLSNAPGALLGSVIFIPAAFGNIILDGKGNYKLPTLKNGGSYKFDKSTSKLTFTTGDLRAFITTRPGFDNGKYRFLLTYDTISYECSHQLDGNKSNNLPAGNQKPAIPAILNNGLRGNMLISTTNSFRGYIGPVHRLNIETGTYSTIFPDGVAIQNTKGELLYVDKRSRIKITDNTGNVTVKQISENQLVDFDDFYPAFSNSGEYYALTLLNTADSGIFKGFETSGKKIVIFNRNGQKVVDFQGYTQAAWTPTGTLIVAGDGNSKRGLFVIDEKFKNVKRLVDEFETAQLPAISPDGKTVAFVKNDEIWTIGIDGSNPKVAIFGATASFPTWSPDGKYVAAVVKAVPTGQVISKNLIYVAEFNTTEGFFLVDKANVNIYGGNRINWVSDLTNTQAKTGNKVSSAETKVLSSPITAYNPTKLNKDPNFAKAYEMYLQVMGEDLDNYNDVSSAITYIVVLNYAYKYKLNGVPTNQVRKVYQQFVDKLLQTSGFKNSDNETKQQLAELAILDGVETITAVNSKDQRKINEVTLRILRKYVGKAADTLKITDNGMEF
jgi:hypothetical protein